MRHEERDTLKRRFRYGTSAAPLARRHPDRLTHIVLRPWTTTLALLLARRPQLAALAYGIQTVRLGRMLRSKGVPARLAPVWTTQALAQTVTQFAHLATPYGAGVLYGRLANKFAGSRRTTSQRGRRGRPRVARFHSADTSASVEATAPSPARTAVAKWPSSCSSASISAGS